jgi:NADPH:quinone reductase-like Zn-dependent oxidoreductase
MIFMARKVHMLFLEAQNTFLMVSPDLLSLQNHTNCLQGCCQEYLSVPIAEIEECPPFLSDEEAAATPLAALTAWRVAIIKAAVKPGDQVLITGIGGGVAIFCLQLAVAYGAKVYVTSGNEEKLRKAKDLGAVGGVNYKDPEWTAKLAEMLPKDKGWLDSVIDSAGGDIVKESLRLLKHGGIISSYGMTLGPKIIFPMQAVMKNIEVCRPGMFYRRTSRARVVDEY